MALKKTKKVEILSELDDLFASSKLTVVAKYRGLSVKAMQELRKEAKANDTRILVVKNRLVRRSIETNDTLKGADTSELKDQLLYAFNANDEVSPAQVLHTFSKKEAALEFVGAITADGTFIGANDVKALATLPSKEQLIAGILNTLGSPVRNVMGGLSGGVSGILSGLEAKASK